MYDFLLVVNTNLPPSLHRFPDIAVDRSKIANFTTPLVFNSSGGKVPLGHLREIFSGCQRVAKVPNVVEILAKITIA